MVVIITVVLVYKFLIQVWNYRMDKVALARVFCSHCSAFTSVAWQHVRNEGIKTPCCCKGRVLIRLQVLKWDSSSVRLDAT